MKKQNGLRLFYAFVIGVKKTPDFITIGECDIDDEIQSSIPKNSPLLLHLAKRHIKASHPDIDITTVSVILSEMTCRIEGRSIHAFTLEQVSGILNKTGILKVPDKPNTFRCNLKVLEMAVDAAIQGRDALTIQEVAYSYTSLPGQVEEKTRTAVKKTAGRKKVSHPAADALDWDEAMSLIKSLYMDGRYRDSLYVATGCFLGLRVSDNLTLRWKDLLSDTLLKKEKKTGKVRSLKINRNLTGLTKKVIEELGIENLDSYIFGSFVYAGEKPITRQRADQILKEAKDRYGIKSAKVFSTHTLRKTFGRRVWQQECSKGRGDQALLLLCDVFGHSSIAITKRYLGIRQEEILSVYDNL